MSYENPPKDINERAYIKYDSLEFEIMMAYFDSSFKNGSISHYCGRHQCAFGRYTKPQHPSDLIKKDQNPREIKALFFSNLLDAATNKRENKIIKATETEPSEDDIIINPRQNIDIKGGKMIFDLIADKMMNTYLDLDEKNQNQINSQSNKYLDKDEKQRLQDNSDMLKFNIDSNQINQAASSSTQNQYILGQRSLANNSMYSNEPNDGFIRTVPPIPYEIPRNFNFGPNNLPQNLPPRIEPTNPFLSRMPNFAKNNPEINSNHS
jgi:hypothetical protein